MNFRKMCTDKLEGLFFNIWNKINNNNNKKLCP